ncbi:MAG: single-stranded DNA-binding protein [Clostridia bacterium]|nr:single-stranded DNA-binding protein [Clostridia bacterium]
MEQARDFNSATIAGSLVRELTYSHSIYGETFYDGLLAVPRLSGTEDILPFTVSDRLLKNVAICPGRFYSISGQMRSYNKHDSASNRLVLTVFARSIEALDAEECRNEIELTGYLCKPPVYRKTPFSREIADLLLAVNRSYNKSDYLPCIAWGRNARFVSELPVGQHLRVEGRVQSRSYQKQLADGTVESRTAYEVSINTMECL